MNFATVEYLVFFAIVFAIYWMLPRRWKNIFLCLSSYAFYAAWDARFLILIFVITAASFIAGARIHASDVHRVRRFWLFASLCVNLGVLGFFKYYNFFTESLVDLAGVFGWHLSDPTLRIILPVGISFYTFQSISYSIDVYQRKMAPTRSFLDFVTFVAFFPQLVAGPIVRAREFLFQLETDRQFQWAGFQTGLTRILRGLFMKIFVADILGVHVVDPVFAEPAAYALPAHWLALAGYTVQVYADFAGYSSIAIGSAQLLGFQIPENFNFPYLARNISHFWRRWHMTMSRFFRDYVYIALGGNRQGQTRALVNVGVTALSSGLWHGASWNFVAYGALHGLYLIVNQLWRRVDGPIKDLAERHWVFGFIPAWTLTTLAIGLTRVFFRSADFTIAAQFLRGMFRPLGEGNVDPPLLALVAFAAFFVDHLVGGLREHGKLEFMVPAPLQAIFYVASMVFLLHAHPTHVDPFIYFQF